MRELEYFFANYGISIIIVIAVFILIRLLFKSSVKNFHSRWSTLIDNFNYSSQDFYKQLTEELQSHGIKGLSTKFVFLKEGNAFSSKRTYLRVTWKDYDYDICAAPFGNGFFISWWLLYKNSFWQLFLFRVPFIGTWLVKKLFPITYYKIDTASMFMSYAQSSVLKIVDTITNNKGVKALSENERKPILKDIFKR
jgi:type II secretory pathway component PulF